MRLIDADLFLENAKNELNCEGKCCECNYYNLCEIYKMVEKQPTAYDVDKVVERLEEFKTSTWSKELEENIEVVNLERATKIVKSGGIE